ncbi:hypothetical protein [Kitasatospora phosalacinea]|uniref:hypothetical protein n=1 Tax=Kitasatospora phosalacinea TaxID=2065 RepID=UPI002553CFD9|nr:hypothetical protein [Kitasatospora phosalacinea]
MGVHLDKALRAGDYLQIASFRWSVDGHGPGEGYARIERVEHIPSADGLLNPEADGLLTMMARGQTTAAVFCQGMPGPLLLRCGGHRVADAIHAQRLAWDETNPTWPPGEPLWFRDTTEPADAHHSRTEAAGPEPLPAPLGA